MSGRAEWSAGGSRRNTLILAAALLVLLLLGLAVQRHLLNKPGLRAVVEVNGERVAVLPLSEDGELTLDETGYNRVRVSDGAVFMAEAGCPDQVCVKTGRVGQPGGVIACLPHRLIVYVESGEGGTG